MSEKHSDTRMRERPDDLPDFTAPPLIEVVIDTQFEMIPEYQQIYAGEVWGLFRDRFPIVEELLLRPSVRRLDQNFILRFHSRLARQDFGS